MAAVVVALAATASTLAIVVALLNIREKLRAARGPHPLEAAVRDIAAALRERGPDLHLRIEEKTHP